MQNTVNSDLSDDKVRPPQLRITWAEFGQTESALWRAENGTPPPKRVVIAEDTLTADAAYHLACEGTALLWRGDFQNAKQMLQAMARRCDAKAMYAARKSPSGATNQPMDAFNLHRQAQSQRARILAMLLIPFAADCTILLRRAPDVKLACVSAWGQADMASVVSLRELLGIIGAYEWRRKGVEVAALQARIYPHYGVFAPIRGEYVELVATAQLPDPIPTLVFDIGTGTGVLAAVLAKRGIQKIIATELDPRALACARDNIERLKLNDRIEIIEANLFPGAEYGGAALIVCNPPWLPARPSSPIERAIYDPDCGMLRGFLQGLAMRLTENGEGWLILSDLAEHLGLRSRETLLNWIAVAGLKVEGRIDVRPHHPRVFDVADILHNARSKEVTSLWRLRAK